jgi:hypothetical protein
MSELLDLNSVLFKANQDIKYSLIQAEQASEEAKNRFDLEASAGEITSEAARLLIKHNVVSSGTKRIATKKATKEAADSLGY